MKKLTGIVFIFCFSLIVSSALCFEDVPADDMYPEEDMYPEYEPEDVGVPDEELLEPSIPINEPEIEEEADSEDDADEEASDYNAFESEIDEIQDDEKAIAED